MDTNMYMVKIIHFAEESTLINIEEQYQYHIQGHLINLNLLSVIKQYF